VNVSFTELSNDNRLSGQGNKYAMRKLIDIALLLNEKVVADYSNPFDPRTTYEIHKNGSKRDLGKLMLNLNPENTSKDVRGILTPEGDLYFFDGAAAAHAGIKSFLGLHRDGIHLNLYHDHVGVGWGRRSPTQQEFNSACEVIKASPRIRAIYGPEVAVEAMVDIEGVDTPPSQYRSYD
jgi:hypothetical protein